MRRWVTMLMGLALLAGCGKPQPEPPAQPAKAPSKTETKPAKSAGPDAKGKRFAVIPKQLDNPVFSYAKQGADAACTELGAKLLWDAPVSADAAKQAQMIETYVGQKVDGIAVSCTNPETLKRAIDKAVDAKIPVVCWDSDAPKSKRQAFYGVDDFGTGKILGEELAALLPKGGKVMILSGVQGAENLEQRVKGVKEALSANKDIKVMGTLYCQDQIIAAVHNIRDTMTQTKDLAGWVLVGGWPMFAQNGLDAIKPGVTKVVAVDPLPQAQKWLENGTVQVCVGQKVFGWGAESVRILAALAAGQPVPNANDKGFVNSGVDLVVAKKEGRYNNAKYVDLASYRKQFDAAATGKLPDTTPVAPAKAEPKAAEPKAAAKTK